MKNQPSMEKHSSSLNGRVALANFGPPLKDSGEDKYEFQHFRYVIIVLGGMMMGSMLFLRLSIAVPMLTMVNKTAIYLREHPNASRQEVEEFFPTDYVEMGEFVWTNEVQQIIMTGYMIAYAIPQLFTTRLAMRFGIRKSIAVSLAVCAISSLLTPTMSYWGWEWCLALRLINAVGASAILPSMVNAIESWMPAQEAAKGLALFQFFAHLGFVIAPLISGYITHLISWRAAFYIPGVASLIISLIWYIVSADNPRSSKFLSRKELDYINGIQNLEEPTEEKKTNTSRKKVEQRTTDLPWYFMFKIASFYPLAIVWSLYCIPVSGLMFLLPNYMNRVLQVPVEEVGALNFTVQFCSLFCMLWQATATKFLQDKFNLSLTAARRILVFATLSIVSASYLYLAIYHDNLVLVVALNRFFHIANDTIFLSTVMSQFGRTGLSGLIYSMINTQGQLGVLLCCWAIGRYLDYTGETLECWSHVMYLMILMVVLHLLVYVIFCRSEPVDVEVAERKPVDDKERA